MKIAYLDCASGISGDMTLGALVDAGVELDALNVPLRTLGLPGVKLVASTVKKKGFRATQITVEHEPEHKHRHLHHIAALIDASQLTTRQKELAHAIFKRLAEAEAKVHDSTIEKVHFHEVGAVDSIADIVGAAIGFDLLGAEQIVCSAVPVGGGFVEIAHGRCSVPAPATAELLRGVPLAESRVMAELTTPTGAAIVATLASRFGPLPAMTIDAIGYGAGQKDFAEQANLLRLVVGRGDGESLGERLTVLETNLDDLSGELIGHTISRLWKAGALDVYTTAIMMKKNRPGVTLSVLCESGQCAALEAILFRETTTLGVRSWTVQRRKLRREARRVATPWGEVDGVVGWIDEQTPRFSPEFESCRQLAENHGLPLHAVYEAAQNGFQSSGAAITKRGQS
jgi:uncharacterized protein (TIGR00299 family) protein